MRAAEIALASYLTVGWAFATVYVSVTAVGGRFGRPRDEVVTISYLLALWPLLLFLLATPRDEERKTTYRPGG